MVCNQINYRFKQNKIRIKRDKAWQFIDKKEKKKVWPGNRQRFFHILVNSIKKEFIFFVSCEVEHINLNQHKDKNFKK